MPVNPKHARLLDVPCVPRLTDVAGPVDLVVVAIPAEGVEAAVDDCVAKGVAGIVVITAGFSETGDEGRRREAAPDRQGARGGNPTDRAQLHGARQHRSRDPARTRRSRPSIRRRAASRSRRRAARWGWRSSTTRRSSTSGSRRFVSVGNKADVSGNDLIQYWSEDPAHRRDPPVPRELRKPDPVLAHRAPRRAPEADRRRQVRPLLGGLAGGLVAHRRARGVGSRRGRALPAGRSHPNRHARGALRRRDAARPPAGPERAARRNPDQRGRARDPGRRRVRGARASRCRRRRRRPRPACASSCRTRRASGTRSTCSRRRRPSTTGAPSGSSWRTTRSTACS